MKNEVSKINPQGKRLLMSGGIVLLFIAVIIMYYSLLYAETKEKIIKSGELSAETSAEKINAYLSTGIHTIELACYTLDNMIRDGRSQKEIDDFLKNQSVAVVNITDGSSDGLYGYINGEYLDGTGWVPDKAYDAVKRPWYIDARACIGRVAVVDPYVDMESHRMMLALSKTLCDAKSVAAMDFSMEELQEIIEELASEEEADMEIIVDRKYQVIANSVDKNEIGKNYMQEKQGLGNALVKAMRVSDTNYFSLKYGGAEYIVYSTKVANDWVCLSVFDATSALGQLKNMLTVTIFAAIIVVGMQVIIMIRLNKRAQAVSELHEKTKQAIAASEAKSAFLSNMSHEIRTPINAILGMNEMVLRESKEQNVLEYSESIHTAGNTLLGIVNDILDFSKIEAGKMEIIPVEYDLSSVINDLVNMIQVKADSKGLALKLDFDAGIPKLLYGDEIRIKQVVTNLLTNAVKYTNEGEVSFGIRYREVENETDAVWLDFTVKDTGIGIKQEDMEKLFSEFERIEEKRNRTIEGTGLGMNITKRLLEMMGTTLDVKSRYGEGTTFSFALKQKVVKWEALGDYESAYREAVSGRRTEYKERFTAKDAIILAVDDTEMNLTVFVNLLKNTQVQIDTAESGKEAIALTREKKYDAIFLDHMMPEMDGIETLACLRADEENKNRETAVICLTANAISGAREKYLAAGFDDYLTKPLVADKLEEMLVTYLPKQMIQMTDCCEEPAEEETSDFPQWLWTCEGIDLTSGIKNCGDLQTYLSVLETFYETIEELAKEIEDYLEADDIRNYTVKVHALKSSARIIGAMELSEKAKRLEEAGNEEDRDFITDNTEALLTLYRAYKNRLAPISPTSASENLPDIEQDMLEDMYHSLVDLIETEDYELIEMVFDTVEQYRMPEEDQDRVSRMQARLKRLDWEGLKEILQEVSK
ncbi:Signal transduction histidine kinase [Lachnospiraceae bacterium XBB1006]|nr:Signal transduction histidine kinase [Lachnospiraceae bacterium XBB1006]